LAAVPTIVSTPLFNPTQTKVTLLLAAVVPWSSSLSVTVMV
jgi:hypothetical protein